MVCKNKKYPNSLIYEYELWNQGYEYICGNDEVGRGCIAGPLVACSIILPKYYFNDQIKDSKQLSANQRIKLANELKQVALAYEIVFIPACEVDKLNPKQASIYAMQQAIKNLKITPDAALVDFEKLNIDIKSISITKGDMKSQSIAAASILAKVYRDQYMIDESKKYHIDYGFETNKGYLTKKHLLAIKKHGRIKNFHRFSYKINLD